MEWTIPMINKHVRSIFQWQYMLTCAIKLNLILECYQKFSVTVKKLAWLVYIKINIITKLMKLSNSMSCSAIPIQQPVAISNKIHVHKMKKNNSAYFAQSVHTHHTHSKHFDDTEITVIQAWLFSNIIEGMWKTP